MTPLIKVTIDSFLKATKVAAVHSYLKNSAFSILTFHRVVDRETFVKAAHRSLLFEEKEFEKLLISLRKTWNIFGLDEAVGALDERKPFPKRSIVITFDDGYRDVYENAFPLLLKYEVPATVFLVTDYIGDSSTYLWWDDMEYWLSRSGDPELEWQSVWPKAREKAGFLDGSSRKSSRKSKELIINKKIAYLSSLPDTSELARYISFLSEKNRSGAEREPLMLNWNQTNEMANSGLIEFGSHTMSHAYLDASLQEELEREVVLSKKKIEGILGRPCRYFSYPGGRLPQNTDKLLASFGYRAAVTTGFGACSTLSNFAVLPRRDAGYVLINGLYSEDRMICLDSGIYDWIY